jgi:hypothetical protein
MDLAWPGKQLESGQDQIEFVSGQAYECLGLFSACFLTQACMVSYSGKFSD